MELSGIKRIYISVDSILKSLEFYKSIVGMRVTGGKVFNFEELRQMWMLPAGTEAEVAILQSERQSTELALVEFKPHSGTFIRNEAENWDYGIFDLAFVVKDLDKLHRELTDVGYQFPTKPVLYEPTFHPGLKVIYSILMGPDRVPIPHIQYLEPTPPPLAHDYGRIMDSAQVVEDMEEALTFYRDLLGLKVMADAEFPAGMLDNLLHLPPQTQGRIALLNQEDDDAPLLELIELSIQGRHLAELAAPSNIGIFMLGFETTSMDTLIQDLSASPFSVDVELESFPMLPHGTERKIHLEGPSRVKLEFFERVSSR